MNNSCILSNDELESVRYLDTAISAFTVLTAILAIGAALSLRLYNQFSYRLALYQIQSAFLRGSVNALQILFVNYYRNESVYKPLCITVSAMLQFSSWAELLFATWVTFHLFCFSVFFRNLKKLEILYVFSTLAASVVLSVIPIATQSYGIGEDGGCWFLHEANGGNIERFVLWTAPVLLVLVGNTLGVIVLVMVLARRIQTGKYKIMDRQYKKALKQMLPLLAYPIVTSVLFMPTVIKTAYNTSHCPSYALTIMNSIGSDGWSFASCLMLLAHIGGGIAVLKCCQRRSIVFPHQDGSSPPVPSYTYYSFPTDNIGETSALVL